MRGFDRRKFLQWGVAASIPVLAMGILNTNTLKSSTNGQTLYVSFINPKPHAGIIVPMPFTGYFLGLRDQKPLESDLSVSVGGNDINIGYKVSEGELLRVYINNCSLDIENLSVLVGMERV